MGIHVFCYKYCVCVLHYAFIPYSYQELPKAAASLSPRASHPLLQHPTTADLLPSPALCSVSAIHLAEPVNTVTGQIKKLEPEWCGLPKRVPKGHGSGIQLREKKQRGKWERAPVPFGE